MRGKVLLAFSVLLVLSRVLDILTTYMHDPDLSGELNPLQSVMGLGLWGIGLANTIVVVIMILSMRFFLKNYQRGFPKEKTGFSDFSRYFMSGGRYSWATIFLDPRLLFKRKCREHFLLLSSGFVPFVVLILGYFPLIQNYLSWNFNYEYLFFSNYLAHTAIEVIVSFPFFVYIFLRMMYEIYKRTRPEKGKKVRPRNAGKEPRG